MRQEHLNGLKAVLDEREDPRSFSAEKWKKYEDAWDLLRRYPAKCTRAELNAYPEIVKLLTTCAMCGKPSEGSTRFPDGIDFPACEECVSKPLMGEFT
jgi:hypothetical protein